MKKKENDKRKKNKILIPPAWKTETTSEIRIKGENAVEQIFTIPDKWFKNDDFTVVYGTWYSYIFIF